MRAIGRLEGFEKYCPSRGIPTLAIVKQGLIFNRNVAKYFGERNPVVFLLNPKKKQIAIQKSNDQDKNAVEFFRKVEVQRLVWRDLISRVMDMVDFDTEHYYYKVKGVISDNANAIVFDLNEAEQKDRVSHNKDEDDQND